MKKEIYTFILNCTAVLAATAAVVAVMPKLSEKKC